MALASGWAQAQWQWIDDAGRKVFSDTPPPASVPDRNILRRPNARAVPVAAPAPESPPESTETAPASAATPGRDEQLEARKKQAEAAEKARQQAEQDRVARIRQENCERANRARTTLMSGIRVSTTNARGEVVVMDDKARAAEMQRLDRIIAADCGPLPQAAQ
ncbi:MAG TPA: DUF4124 domain-containing protein [Paracoccaceae bacterium]|nr:DUF4124 domain-containing protein [Paracoccaceae bacterium]